MIYAWGNNPRRAELKGRRCEVVVRGGTMRSVLVQFENGDRVVTSSRALRAELAEVPPRRRGDVNDTSLVSPAAGQRREREGSTGEAGPQGGRRPLVTLQREVLIERTYRTGVQTVSREGDRYFVTIRNRTYRSEHEVPIETARRWYRVMKGEQ